jgi:hypothetical protein
MRNGHFIQTHSPTVSLSSNPLISLDYTCVNGLETYLSEFDDWRFGNCHASTGAARLLLWMNKQSTWDTSWRRIGINSSGFSRWDDERVLILTGIAASPSARQILQLMLAVYSNSLKRNVRLGVKKYGAERCYHFCHGTHPWHLSSPILWLPLARTNAIDFHAPYSLFRRESLLGMPALCVDRGACRCSWWRSCIKVVTTGSQRPLQFRFCQVPWSSSLF